MTCILVGNGPSLADVPRAFLDRYPTFGVNKIYLYRGFTPTYYVCVDGAHVNPARIHDMDCIKYTSTDINEGNVLNVTLKPKTFSYRPLARVWGGWNVLFVSLQLAYFLGYHTALIVGTDWHGGHFTPGYKGIDFGTNDAQRLRAERALALARRAWEADGRRIINLTPNTQLEVFEKGSLSEWLPQSL